ncbi:L-cystatin-like [Ambystoma mexicanum]|uniref:L-cystatin-like n=1 Tax=Ambystoma mexicanum TaxID=8296 RepID=UPI0037E9288C
MAASRGCCAVLLLLMLLLAHPGLLRADPQQDEPVITATKAQPLLGGWSDINTEGKEAKDMAAFVEVETAKMSNGRYVYQTVAIEKAQMQVVYGVNYYLKYKLMRSPCLTFEEGAVCKEPDPSKSVLLSCDARIWVEPKTQQKKMNEQTCTL